MQVSQATPTATLAGSFSLVKFATPLTISDTHGGFSTSSGGYTCPVTGYYRVIFSLEMSATYALNSAVAAGIGKNSTTVATLQNGSFSGGAETSLYGVVSGTILCNSGDVLYPLAASTGTTPTVTSNAPANYFHVERLSGPAVVAASESVYASYTDTSGGSIPVGSSTTYTYATKIRDSHNAYSGGTYTVPVSGMYNIAAQLSTTSLSLTTSGFVNLYIKRNGTAIATNFTYGNGTSQSWSATAQVNYYLNAGDTIIVVGQCSTGTTASTSASFNNFAITRIGN